MGKPAPILFAALTLLPLLSSAFAPQAVAQTAPPSTTVNPATAEARNRVVGFTAWDDDYFYIAVQVNKPALKAKDNEPFSDPLADDAVIVAVQTDNDHQTTKRTAKTVTVAISAANGSQLYTGADAKPLFKGLQDLNNQLEDILKNEKNPDQLQARRDALLGSVIKYRATPKGAALSSVSNAPGYTVELAIPWRDLGGKPDNGAKMGFHVAAQSPDPNAGSPPLQALSSRVKASSDLNNPSLWDTLVFSNAPASATGDTYVCPRVFANKPVIDGELLSGEWNGLSSFEFGERAVVGGGGSPLARTLRARVRPDFTPRPSRPVVPPVVRALQNVVAHHPQPLPPLVLARYDYQYQADTRKAAPAANVIRSDGSTALTLHPLDSVGPWFSYDRADWHRRQLVELRRAGVDVILPNYRGAARDRQLYADKGLIALATALQSLRSAGEDYPQVALALDTSALIETFGDRPDLREPATQAALYAMIRNFYRHVPAPFRLLIPLTAENGGRSACVVVLSDASAFKGLDSTFTDTLRAHFAADFDGADLLILGASNFKPGAALDGYLSEPTEKGFQLNTDGWIKTGVIGAGSQAAYLNASPTSSPRRPRRNGETYRADWTAALAKRPDWVLLSGWNDYTSGAAIAPTIEAGYTTSDLTKIYTRLFAGPTKLAAKFLGYNAPPVLVSGSVSLIEARAQNTGQEIWSATSAPGQTPLAFTYRWRQKETVVASGTTTMLPTTVLPGQNVSVTLPVKVRDASDAPLPDGDYTLEIGLVSPDRRASLAALTDGLSVRIPVAVRSSRAAPAWAATLVSTDLPTTPEAGSVYEVHATLRNDGAATWRKAEGARVSLRLYRTAETGDVTAKGDQTAETLVASADASADLPQDVPPGQLATVHLLLPLTDPEGKPLPAWNQEMLWTYMARWEVASDAKSAAGVKPAVATDSPDTPDGVSICPTPLAVVPFDFGVRFTSDGTPDKLPGERRLPVRLSLQNVGAQVWKKEEVRVGYHWRYQDGSEFLWEDETTPLPQDVPPGGSVTDMLAWVTAPPCDGLYYLVWDVKVGDTWASTSSSARVFDEIVHPVTVIGGHLVFADLTKAYTLDGVTDEDTLKDGDFDGQGDTFPAGITPPFANAPVAPSAMWIPSAKSGPDSIRRISFKWGSKEPKDRNFIVCKGQRVDFGKSGGQCRVLHVLAASINKDVLTSLKLIFQEPTSESEDLYSFSVSRWDRPPSNNDPIAFLSYGHHNREGIQPGAVALYHYMITIRDPRKLIAVVLPNEPDIRIAAMTLEK